MLFYYAKREGTCRGCGGGITRDDFCVKQFIKNKDFPSGYILTFHYDCFIDATLEHIRLEAVKYISAHNSNGKLGRPSVYTDGKKADSLKHLIKYYKDKGNTTKTLELEKELAKLVIH